MTPTLEAFIRAMPKVELHVHLEGAIPPVTLLALAKRNGVGLPATTVDEIEAWYTFRDFAHFAEVYTGTAACIFTPDDVELVPTRSATISLLPYPPCHPLLHGTSH